MVAVAWLLVAVPEVIRMTKKKEEKNKKKEKERRWAEGEVSDSHDIEPQKTFYCVCSCPCMTYCVFIILSVANHVINKSLMEMYLIISFRMQQKNLVIIALYFIMHIYYRLIVWGQQV